MRGMEKVKLKYYPCIPLEVLRNILKHRSQCRLSSGGVLNLGLPNIKQEFYAFYGDVRWTVKGVLSLNSVNILSSPRILAAASVV